MRVAVLVERHAGRGLQQLPVQGGEDPDVVVAAGGGAHDAGVLVNSLQELANDQRHGLDPLNLLLGVDVLLPQVPHLVLDVLFLHPEELKLLLQLLVLDIEVICIQLIIGGGKWGGGSLAGSSTLLFGSLNNSDFFHGLSCICKYSLVEVNQAIS